ncbi:unnamed protein product [Rotaria sordida]|uniref:Uncharacterized protein n=1 Tax=Rotaria sordida TaxID=392033 RepID=A0A815M6T7_9BILA|nr:unnamed protein product [Rotaria sordida]CAF3996806.1 unnamed protein product [Rotaria sordida]
MDIQKLFKQRHDQKLNQEHIHLPLDIQKRLDTYSKQSIKSFHYKWSLQMAIAYTCHEFLDKNSTKSGWSRNLDIINNNRLSIMDTIQKETIQQMIQYAVNDCLAVTKLVSILKVNRTEI